MKGTSEEWSIGDEGMVSWWGEMGWEGGGGIEVKGRRSEEWDGVRCRWIYIVGSNVGMRGRLKHIQILQ